MIADRWYCADLINWRPLTCAPPIVCLDGRLVIEPDWDAELGPDMVTATLRISHDLSAGTQGNAMPCTVVPIVCDLLSFASRRRVSFAARGEWWPSGHEYIARGPDWKRGPVELPHEIRLLLDRAMPKLLDDAEEARTRVGTALRWFLSAWMQHGLDVRYLVLWMALEMSARVYLGIKPDSREGIRGIVERYLCAIGLTNHKGIPVKDLYSVRNCIVHGNVDVAPNIIQQAFGTQAEERKRVVAEFDASIARHFGGQTDGCKGAKVEPWNEALYEAAIVLTRVMEKILLARWECTDFSFYRGARYDSPWAP